MPSNSTPVHYKGKTVGNLVPTEDLPRRWHPVQLISRLPNWDTEPRSLEQAMQYVLDRAEEILADARASGRL